MSYFLKQTRIKRRIFLQIAQTTYNKEKKTSSNKRFRKIGYLDELILKGMDDPISFYKLEVEQLNAKETEKKNNKKKLKISKEKNLNIGSFIIKNLLNTFKIETSFNDLLLSNNADLDTYNIFEHLLFSKIYNTSISLKDYSNYFEHSYFKPNYTDKQIIKTLDFIGDNYVQILEILNSNVINALNLNTDLIFFYSTKSFFENSKSSKCINITIILNKDMIPLNILIKDKEDLYNDNPKNVYDNVQKLYPSSKIIRLSERTVNYENNIYNCLTHKEAYIVPLSLSLLNETEKNWIFSPENYENMYDSEGEIKYKLKSEKKEYLLKIEKNDGTKALAKAKQKRVASFDPLLEKKKKEEILNLVEEAKFFFSLKAKKHDYSKSLKYIKIIKEEGKEDKIQINQTKIDNELKYAGYKLIVTSETYLKKDTLFKIYDKTWEIGNYFRQLKNQLELNKRYLKTKKRVFGHYIISYTIFLLYRVLETVVLKNELEARNITEIIRDFNVLKIKDEYINLLKPSINVDKFQNLIDVSIDFQYFTKNDISNLYKKKIHI